MKVRIAISPRFSVAFTLALAALALFLTLMNVFSHVSHHLVGEHLPGSVLESILEPLDAFQLDRERSFPTLYVATLWLLCSVLLAGITLSRRAIAARYVRHWGVLATIFLCLFTDELLQIHEKTIEPLRYILGTSGLLYYAWVVPALILLLVFGVLYAKFVIALPSRLRLLFLTAGLVFVTGAVGFEMIGGYYDSFYGKESAGFIVSSTVEEFLEMLGLTVFIYALLEYMRLYVGEIVVPPASKKL